jgi:hypothetical protein
MELSAFVHHHTKVLGGASTTLASATSDDFPATIKGILSTLTAASHFAQVTRFNWSAMVRGDMEEFFTAWDNVQERVKATQILSLIDKMPGEEKRAARFFYEMLCDYVHPNVGAARPPNIGDWENREASKRREGIFPLDRVAQSQHRIVASSLRDSHISCAQDARNDSMRLFGPQPLGKPPPVAFARRHGRPLSSPGPILASIEG